MSNIELVDSPFTSNKPYLFRGIYEWILDNGGTPYLLVDATQADVQVPREFVKDGQIVLNASPSAIQGWFVDNQAISFSARFSGKAQNIFIPMKSLLAAYAQENGAGMAFPVESSDGSLEETFNTSENLQEVKKSDIKETETKKTNSNRSKAKKGASHLKVIK